MTKFLLRVFCPEDAVPGQESPQGELERVFTFRCLEDALTTQEILIWLDPDPCVGSYLEEEEVVEKATV